MRPIWSGMISFGLVNIPVRLNAATEPQTLDFDFLNRKDLAPVRYVRVDGTTGEQVAYRDIVRGYKYQEGEYIVLQDEDFKRASVRKTQTISLVDFVDEDEIDVKLIEKPYYLEPEKEGKNVYGLLREALRRTGKVGVGRFVLKTREHLCMLKADGDVIVLIQMRFAGEVRSTAGLDLPAKTGFSENELELAVRLIKQSTRPFHPEDFKDTYNEELRKLINEKAHGKKHRVKAEEPEPTAVTELLSKLRSSLEYAGSGKK